MSCPKCGAEIETPVVSVQEDSEGCRPCIAGPDQMMLRKVVLETETGTEVVLVRSQSLWKTCPWQKLGRDEGSLSEAPHPES
jgi:hypothetical protein